MSNRTRITLNLQPDLVIIVQYQLFHKVSRLLTTKNKRFTISIRSAFFPLIFLPTFKYHRCIQSVFSHNPKPHSKTSKIQNQSIRIQDRDDNVPIRVTSTRGPQTSRFPTTIHHIREQSTKQQEHALLFHQRSRRQLHFHPPRPQQLPPLTNRPRRPPQPLHAQQREPLPEPHVIRRPTSFPPFLRPSRAPPN